MTSQDYEYSNQTVYSIKSDAVRYTLAGYYLFVITSSFIGDTIILIASIKYKAFKLHKVITVIIQHIAVCDLMVSVAEVLPKVISISAGEWVLGRFLSYLLFYLKLFFMVSSLLLICTMTTSKVLLLEYPLRLGATSSNRAHVICVASWLAALGLPLIHAFVDRQDIFFSYRVYSIEYGYSSDIWKFLRPLSAVIFGVIPTCLVVANTMYLLIKAKRVARRGQESLKWQGINATILTAMVYCLSALPMATYYIGESRIKVSDGKSQSFFHTSFYRIASISYTLNTICNFYIYSLTVNGFRNFLQSIKPLMFHWLSTNFEETSTKHGEKFINLVLFTKLINFSKISTQLSIFSGAVKVQSSGGKPKANTGMLI